MADLQLPPTDPPVTDSSAVLAAPVPARTRIVGIIFGLVLIAAVLYTAFAPKNPCHGIASNLAEQRQEWALYYKYSAKMRTVEGARKLRDDTEIAVGKLEATRLACEQLQRDQAAAAR